MEDRPTRNLGFSCETGPRKPSHLDYEEWTRSKFDPILMCAANSAGGVNGGNGGRDRNRRYRTGGQCLKESGEIYYRPFARELFRIHLAMNYTRRQFARLGAFMAIISA